MNNAALVGMRMVAESATIGGLRDRAYAQVAQWPQYTRARFDHYVPIRIKRTVKTKAGIAFRKGEVVLAQTIVRYYGTKSYVTAWSFSNKVDTSIDVRDFEFLGGAQ